MCDPYFKVKKVCEKNNVSVFSSNFSLYTNISDRVMKTLEKNCPQVQVYSVDEAFCDLTGIRDCPFTTNPGQQIPILTQPVMLLNQILI